jgi:hypothetical protein
MKSTVLSVIAMSALALLTVLAASVASFAASPAIADCNQDYYPLKLGEKYVYVVDGRKDVRVLAKVDRSSFAFESTLEQVSGAPSITVTSTGSCGPDGITVDWMSTDRLGVKFLKRTGADFLSAAAMKVGRSWTSGVTTEMTVHGKTITMTTSATHRAVAIEMVRVPAGEYQALRIESLAETTTTMSPPDSGEAGKGPQTMPAASRAETTFWLVKGVGAVKVEVTVASGPSGPKRPPITMELLTFAP